MTVSDQRRALQHVVRRTAIFLVAWLGHRLELVTDDKLGDQRELLTLSWGYWLAVLGMGKRSTRGIVLPVIRAKAATYW